MSGGGKTHWCYNCSQAILPRGHTLSCPYCEQGFVEELPETPSFHNQRFGFMDAFSEVMRRRMDGRDLNFDVRTRPGMLSGRRSGSGSSPRVLIFHGQSDPFEFFFNAGLGGRRQSHFGDFFSEPGIQELVEQLSMNDRRGPPPAPRSAIDAMPTIRITQRHVNTDAQCPVCQDKFEIGSKARQMPCDHIYHSDCIVPWLVEHNSCPVCRVELPSPGSAPCTNPNRGLGTGHSSDSGGTSGHGSRDENHSRWNPFSFLWHSNSSS